MQLGCTCIDVMGAKETRYSLLSMEKLPFLLFTTEERVWKSGGRNYGRERRGAGREERRLTEKSGGVNGKDFSSTGCLGVVVGFTARFHAHAYRHTKGEKKIQRRKGAKEREPGDIEPGFMWLSPLSPRLSKSLSDSCDNYLT